ncbi:YybH family protein [Streptomyces avicenniae]|uniref:YybH family protein n=1 Tax=Streptomyces avicenniae TaxID=500153 RepID=UPI00069B3425|nr:nuclear transport factor 2 family protein [Streptomyces avicenniae]
MSTQRDRDEGEVRRRLDMIVEGIRAKDAGILERVYAADVVSFDVEPPLRHVGREAKMRNWAKVFTFFQDVGYEMRDLTVAVDGDVAFAYCLARLSGTLQNGVATDGMWVRGTFCLRRTDGTWLVAHDQASVPFDLTTGRGVADLEP